MSYGFSDGGLGDIAIKIGAPRKSISPEAVTAGATQPAVPPIVPAGQTVTAAMQTPAQIVRTDTAPIKELINPPAVLVGTPAPQAAGLFDGSNMKALLIIAIPLIVLGFLTSEKNTNRVRR